MARKDKHPHTVRANNKADVRGPPPPQKGVYQKKIPKMYKGKEGKAEPLSTRQHPADKTARDTATVQNIINNPSKHKGVTVKSYSGPAHPDWARRKMEARHSKSRPGITMNFSKTNSAKAPKSHLLSVHAPKPQIGVTETTSTKTSTRKRPGAMTPQHFVQEKAEADKARAAKILKHEQEQAKEAKKAHEASNPLKAAEIKKAEAVEHLESKARADAKRG